MKKLTALLAQRPALLRQLRLANLAFAHATLTDVHERFLRSGLSGRVLLQSEDPASERFCVALTALDGAQSVVEEHFADDHLAALADVIGFLTAQDPLELTFRIEEFAERFLAPVRDELVRSGVELDASENWRDPVGG